MVCLQFWIDAPVGVGYSTVAQNGYALNEDQMATDFVCALASIYVFLLNAAHSGALSRIVSHVVDMHQDDEANIIFEQLPVSFLTSGNVHFTYLESPTLVVLSPTS
jgi:hypothetical protein